MGRKRNESEKVVQSYIPFSVIAKAVNGDSDAIKAVTAFYENYIRSFLSSPHKGTLYADYGKLKKRVMEYDVIKRNIDSILKVERQPERDKETERG